MYNLLAVFLMFMIYSVIGYVAEITFCSVKSKKLIWNRGFLIGPYLPIYGTGAIAIVSTLGRYRDDFIALFVMSMFYCLLIEYFTSYIMEKIFHLRWWDYSDKKYNINGRVCLTNGVLFGIGGLVIVRIINPIIHSFVYNLSPMILYIVSSTLLVIYLSDTIVSFRIVFALKNNIKKIADKDATNQIKKEVTNFLKNYNVLTNRLLKSFPYLSEYNGKRFEKFLAVFSSVRNEIKKLRHKK